MIVQKVVNAVRSRFFKDTAMLQAAAMYNQASTFITNVVLAYMLGSHGQGLLFLALSLQALFYNLINVGVMQATVTQVAAASVRDIRAKVAGWLAFLLKSHLLFSSLLIGIGWFALPALSEYLYTGKLGREAARELGIWAWWLTFWPILDTPRVVIQVAFQGTRRMRRLSQMDVGAEVLRFLLVLIGVVATGSPVGAVLGEVSARLLGSIMAFDLYRTSRHESDVWLPPVREILRRVLEVPLWQGLQLGLRVGVLKNGQTLFMDVFPSLIVGRMAGASWVAYFGLATKFMRLPFMMLQGVARTILPALSELRGVRDLERFRTLYYRVSLISGGVITAVLAVMLPLLPPFVGALWPADFRDPVFRYALILGMGMVPTGFAVGLDAFYILTDQMRRNLILMGVGAAITIPTFLLLIWWLPETGAAWGLSLYRSWTLVHFIYVAWYFRFRAKSGHWER